MFRIGQNIPLHTPMPLPPTKPLPTSHFTLARIPNFRPFAQAGGNIARISCHFRSIKLVINVITPYFYDRNLCEIGNSRKIIHWQTNISRLFLSDLFILLIYLQRIEKTQFNDIAGKKEKKKRYAYLVTENLGNFQRIQEMDIMVLTHIAWAAITTFVYSGFPRTFS